MIPQLLSHASITRHTIRHHRHRQRPLTPFLIGVTNNRALHHRLRRHDLILQQCRINPLPARPNHITGPIMNRQIPIRRHRPHIPRVQPPVRREMLLSNLLIINLGAPKHRRRTRPILRRRMIIRPGHPITPHLDFPLVSVRLRHNLPIIDHPIFHRRRKPALTNLVRPARLPRNPRRGARHRAYRGCFRHAPHVHNIHTITLLP